MKKLIFLILIVLNYAFEVGFTKVYKEYIIPKNDAYFIQTKANNLTFPFKYIKTEDGYILIGDLQEIDNFLNNNFYAPKDAKFKTIKISYIDFDKIQYKIIKKIKNVYKNCKIKKIIFLTPDEEKIILKPKEIVLKYKIILKCK